MRMKHSFSEATNKQPIVPYIRFTDYAVRKAGWVVPDRRLLDYLLIYIQDGTCKFEVGGVLYTFAEGDFCLIQPDLLCSLEGVTDTITPYVHFDLFYNPLREQSFMTKPGETDIHNLRHLLQPRLNDFESISIPVQFRLPQRTVYKESLLKLIGLWQNGDPLSRLEANQLLGEMMIGLLKEYSDLQKEAEHYKPQSLNWITSYFSNYLSESLTLADMAARARLSPSRFSAVFKAKFGISPHRYLMNMRIQHAQELIRKGGYSLDEIAHYLGFSDAAHFSKAYKKITGETPGQSRKKH